MQRLKLTKWPVFLALILCSEMQAQRFFLFRNDSAWRQSESLFSLEGMAIATSSGLNTGFMKKWIYGGELTRESLTDISDRLSSVNRFGAEAYGVMEVLDFTKPVFGKEKWGLKIRLDQHSLAQGTFTKDVFKLIFLGNKNMVNNQGGRISPSGFELVTWQKLGIGVFNKDNLSNVTISFVSGQRLAMFNTRKSGLWTEDNGQELILELNGAYLRSDTTLSGFGAGNGVGFALDTDQLFPLKNKRGFVGISLRDVGLVKWNDRTIRQDAETRLQFTGFDLAELIDGGNTRFDIEDSIFQSTEQAAVWKWLPAQANVFFQLRSKSDLFYELGIEVRPTYHHVPRTYGAFGKFVGENWLVKITTDLAGYGAWNAGLSVDGQLGRQWYLSAGCANVAGLVSDKMHTLHGGLALRKFFGKSKWTN